MAKSNKSNPLKTFNDNYDKKVKKVTEGNKKLVKAQFGIAGNPYSNTADNYKKKMQQDEYNKKIKERDLKYNQQMSEAAERYRKANTSAIPTATATPSVEPYKPYPSLEKEMNKRASLGYMKKGGQKKSKKK